MNDISVINKDVVCDVLVSNNDEILPVKEMPNTDMQKIVIYVFSSIILPKNVGYYIAWAPFTGKWNTDTIAASICNK